MSAVSTRRRVGLALLAVSIITIAFLTLAPPLASDRESEWCVICGDQVLGDVLLNVALFVPLGVGFALLGTSRWRAFGVALIATTTIELTQGFLLRGRFASVSDIVTNSTGAVLGHVLGSHWRLLLVPSATAARRLAGVTMLVWLAILAGAAWALKPPLVTGDYSIVTLDDMRVDDGDAYVREVALLRTISDSALIDARPQLEHALQQRELMLLARFRPLPDDTLIASVYRTGSSPVISIRHGGGLLFVTVHTPGRMLHLYEPTIFWGPLGFLASTRDSIISIAGGVDRDSIRLFALRGTEITDRTSLGLAPAVWLFLLIGQGPGMQFVIPLSALLNAALLVPAAYWAVFVLVHSGYRNARGALGLVAALALLVVVGFIGVPKVTGLAPTPRIVWIASLVGMGMAGVAAFAAAGRAIPVSRRE